ncbi:hypothetical protein NQ315_014881 [Exocentrus adspersus]|uniref:Transposase n=1 Tax=Exocentrus adspersus TaxID=1586481 RepID=A0AAV8VKU4_9CUCU|nr:hypothetical protein NQ315_014881 [Exocentrus adspersus]
MSSSSSKHATEKIQLVNELHKPARKNYPRRRTIIKGLDDLWPALPELVQLYQSVTISIVQIKNCFLLICALQNMDKFVVRKRKLETQPSTSSATPDKCNTLAPEIGINDNDNSSSETLSQPDSGSSDIIIQNKKKKKYSRKFRDVWLSQYSWLKLLESGQKICIFCNKPIEGGKSHLDRHEKNTRHNQLKRQIVNTKNVASLLQKNSEKDRLLNSVTEAEYKLIMGLIVEHNSPMLLMDHLPKLLASSAPDSKIINNIKCARSKTTQMIHMLKAEAESVLVEQLKVTKFSIIIDETTDISSKKCLAILVRFVDNNSCVIKENLLGLVEVEKCDAEGLTRTILDVLHKFDIDHQNVIGFAADNASVMMGEFGGVQAKLKQLINQNIFVIGCICHSLHLCASEACKKIPSGIEEFVQDIYNYISRSPKRLKIYAEFQQFVELKPHKLLRLSQTRWLSLEAVVKRVLEQWQGLKLFFISEVSEEKDFARPNSILEKLNNYEYELYLNFIAHVLPMVNKLNIEFQSETPKIHLLFERITSLYKTILKYYLKRQYVDNINNILKLNPLNAYEYLPNDNIYLGIKVELLIKKYNLKQENLIQFYNNCLNFYTELCVQIRKRFHNLTIYENFKLLNPSQLLEEPVSFMPLLEQFPHLVNNNMEEIAAEAREISSLSNDVKTKLKELEFTEFWFELYQFKNSAEEVVFKNICLFVYNIFSLPHSSASAERIFSQLNLIKSKVRNRLLPETCNSLLMAKTLLGKNKCFEWQPGKDLVNKPIIYHLNGAYNWLDILPEITDNYNKSRHSTTGYKPIDVTKSKEKLILKTVYNHIKISGVRKFKVGDIVRISKNKHVFAKGYTPNWTTELFKITAVKITNPITCLLEDMRGQPIQGAFYAE